MIVKEQCITLLESSASFISSLKNVTKGGVDWRTERLAEGRAGRCQNLIAISTPTSYGGLTETRLVLYISYKGYQWAMPDSN